MGDDRNVTAALIAWDNIFYALVRVHGVLQKRLIEIKIMEAERLQHVNFFFG